MTELQFLIDLLLNHKLSRSTKEAVSKRIGEVESAYSTPRHNPSSYTTDTPYPGMVSPVIGPTTQSPSTQRILDQIGKESAQGSYPDPQANANIMIAQTPATAMAMRARQEAIAISLSGKEEKGRTSPRKF